MISSFLPDWAEPVLRYMLEVGLRGTLQIAALSLTGSLLIGVTLGAMYSPFVWPDLADLLVALEQAAPAKVAAAREGTLLAQRLM